jgi:hypothetical protein
MSTAAPAQLPTPAQLADALAASMHGFWETVALLEPDELETPCLEGGWTPKAVVAHVAFWDDYQTRRMEAALTGASAQTGFARPVTDNDERALDDQDRPWSEIEAAAQAARDRLVAFARTLPPEALAHEYPEGDRTLSLVERLQHMARHVRNHRRDLQRYCGSMTRWSRPALRALMVEQHENLMDSMGGLSEATMLAEQVCGHWTIRDVLAHVLSWSEYCVHLLTHWPEPDAALVSEWAWQEGDTMAIMDERLLAARTHLTMIDIADGLSTCHRKIMTAFDRFSDADLQSEGMTWGGPGVLSNFFFEIYTHEAEHAAHIWAYQTGERMDHSH